MNKASHTNKNGVKGNFFGLQALAKNLAEKKIKKKEKKDRKEKLHRQ